MTDKTSQDSQTYGSIGRSRSLTEALSDVLEPVLARKTGMKLDLVRAWSEISGEEFSQTTRPEKINWPRPKDAENPFEPGILVIACEPSAAVFLQHQLAPLLERINVFFGFHAIERIRLVQKPVLKSKSQPLSREVKLTAEQATRLLRLIASVDDPKLRETLEKLGKGILTDRKQ